MFSPLKSAVLQYSVFWNYSFELKRKKNRSKSSYHLHFTVSKVLFIKSVNSKSPQCTAGYNIIDLKAPNVSDQEQLQTEKASAVRSSLGNKPPEMSWMETLASYGKFSEAFLKTSHHQKDGAPAAPRSFRSLLKTTKSSKLNLLNKTNFYSRRSAWCFSGSSLSFKVIAWTFLKYPVPRAGVKP